MLLNKLFKLNCKVHINIRRKTTRGEEGEGYEAGKKMGEAEGEYDDWNGARRPR